MSLARNQLFCSNQFDKLPDSLAQKLVDRFSLANDYGDYSTIEDLNTNTFQDDFEKSISYECKLGKFTIETYQFQGAGQES